MTSIKVKFRPSTVAEHEGTIYYQIIRERKVRQLLSHYKIYACEWDDKRSTIKAAHKRDVRTDILLSIREHIGRDVERLMTIDRKLDAQGLTYTADDIIHEFKQYMHDYSLFNFMESVIAKLKLNGRHRTSETYKSTLNSFRRFLSDTPLMAVLQNDGDIMLDCLNAEIMESYEAWHKQRGVAPNTISFYIRVLRAVYNRAVNNDIIKNRNPFRHVYTGIDKTIKRALPLSAIKKIKTLDLPPTRPLDYARDMFMLSFYLRGMSFVDMAYLKKSDLQNGYITYRRRKTGQLLIIEWTKEMQMILDKYPENRSVYLLPIIRNSACNERCAYRNACYNINRNLKNVATLAHISTPLTLYVARHSWASAAKAKGIPLAVISEGMGHDSETTTQIYLASLDTSAVDKANSIIISSL